jgi:hypothetical protein
MLRLKATIKLVILHMPNPIAILIKYLVIIHYIAMIEGILVAIQQIINLIGLRPVIIQHYIDMIELIM